MEFMLDTLNLDEIKKWSAILPLSGVTSNPTIVKKEGKIDFFEQVKEVRLLVGDKPSLHVQVVAEDVEGILTDARKLREELGEDVYIKVPVSQSGLTAIKVLKKEGFKITATAIYTVFQGLLAIEAGADYLAPYCNRMENLNIDFVAIIKQLSQVIDREQYPTKILAASFKNVGQLTAALEAGAHAVTAGPDIFAAGFAHPSIHQAVEDFAADWQDSQGRSTI